MNADLLNYMMELKAIADEKGLWDQESYDLSHGIPISWNRVSIKLIRGKIR